MQYKNYTDPIINNYRRNEKGIKQSKRIDSEVHKIVNSKVALSEIPDEEQVLKIDGYDETKVKEVVLGDKQFRVDYTNGFIYFSPSQDGATVDVSYFGLGVTYFPASRVWLEVDGENNVKKTLGDMQEDIEVVKKVSASQEQLKKDLDEQSGKFKNIIDTVQNVDLAKIENTVKEASQANNELIASQKTADKVKTDLEALKNESTSLSTDLAEKNTQAKQNIDSLASQNSQAKEQVANLQSEGLVAVEKKDSLSNENTKANQAISQIVGLIHSSNDLKQKLEEIIASGDLDKYVTDPKLQNILTAYATKDDLSKVDVTSQLIEYAKKSEVPTSLSQLTDDSTHRLVTDTEKEKWNSGSGVDLSGYAKKEDILASKVVDTYKLNKEFREALTNDKEFSKAVNRDMLTLVIFDGNNKESLVAKAGFESILYYKGQVVGISLLPLGGDIDENFVKANNFSKGGELYVIDDTMYQYNAVIQKQIKELTTATSSIPKSLSQLANDTKFKTEAEIQEMVAKINSMTVEVVDSLPTTGKDKTIYLVKDSKGSGDNNHLEYLWVKSKWELVGSTQVDLSGYAKKEDVEKKQDKITLGVGMYKDPYGKICAHQYNDAQIVDRLQKAEAYKANKTELKTKLSEMTDDATHRLVTDTEKTNWNNKVDKVDGKTLSTNDFTNDYKNTIDTIKNTALAITSNSSDLNTLTKAGFYSCRGCSNRPANGHSYATLIVSKADTTTDGSQTDTVQFYLDMDNNAFIRNSIDKSGTWTDWVQLGGHATKVLTESEYNGLSNKDANTLYFIK